MSGTKKVNKRIRRAEIVYREHGGERIRRYRKRLAEKIASKAATALGRTDGCNVDDIKVFIVRKDDEADRRFPINQTVAHDDERLKDFRRIGRKDGTSGTVIVLDKDTGEVVLAIRIRLFKDMSENERKKHQEIFSYLHEDTAYHQKITTNGPQVQGHMYAVGWRCGTERGVNFNTYHPKAGVKKSAFRQHCSKLEGIMQLIEQSFYELTPAICERQKKERLALKVPATGMEHKILYRFCQVLIFK